MSKTSVFIKAQDFHPTVSNVEFSDVNWGSTGYGSISLKYQSYDMLLKAPRLTSPFGFSRGIPNTSSYGRDFNLQFNLEATTQKTKAFYEGLTDLEDVIVRYAYEHRVEWGLYGNQTEAERATLEEIREKFTPIIRPPKEGSNFPPTFKVNFRTFYNKDTKKPKITTDCQNEENNNFEPSEETIPRRSQCIPIIRAKNIWISPNGRFGLKWQIERIKVYQPEVTTVKTDFSPDPGDQRMITGQCLLDSDSE